MIRKFFGALRYVVLLGVKQIFYTQPLFSETGDQLQTEAGEDIWTEGIPEP